MNPTAQDLAAAELYDSASCDLHHAANELNRAARELRTVGKSIIWEQCLQRCIDAQGLALDAMNGTMGRPALALWTAEEPTPAA